MLPSTILAIVCDPSNCDKTNVFISLLKSPHGVRFENVYVYSKSLQQPKYQYLENLLSSTDEIGYFTFFNNSDVIPPNEAHPNSISFFDDVACDKQDTVREYFSMGRHSHVGYFYLCQSYASIPKFYMRQRESVNLVQARWYQPKARVQWSCEYRHVILEDFSELCRNCWQQKYGFLVIDKDSALTNGRYRKGFNEFAVPRSG